MPFSFKQELRFPGGLVRNPKAEHVWQDGPNGDKRWVLSLQFLLDWCTMAGKLSTGGDAWWRIILLCAWTSGRWRGFRRWALPIWATGCLNYWCEAGSVDTAGRGCRICTGRRYLTCLPRRSPGLWSCWSRSSRKRSETCTAGAGTPISTPSPSTPPPRNTPGPQDWSASLASCFWRGRRNESTSCLSQ